jgi:hypothetical protein
VGKEGMKWLQQFKPQLAEIAGITDLAGGQHQDKKIYVEGARSWRCVKDVFSIVIIYQCGLLNKPVTT